ncbi:MFS transporter [Austwickia chelonae]|uniref:MFS transporter n=1 Tax=Austwickia chelonae TaxID=100225 RepID=UPI000E275CE3|nr:MFS transporter [Austwickia chelonae]
MNDTPAVAKTTRPPIPREIWVLVAAAFCVAIGFGLVSPILPAYAHSFDVGVQAAAAIVSVFALMRLLFAPASGQLIARLGERRIYLTGILIVALSTGACALATGYWQLLLFRGLGGVGSTMFTVSASALIVRLSPPTIRGRVSSLYGSGFLIGGILGPVLGTAMSGFGFRMPFVVYALTLLAAAGVVAAFLGEEALRPKPGTPALPVMTVREAWADNAYRALMVSTFCHGWANFGLRVALLPLFASTVPGMGVGWAGVALTVFAVGNAVMLPLAGRLVDEIGRKPLVIGGLLVNGAATAVIGLSHSVIALLVVSLLAGVGSGAIGPGQQATVADIVGHDRNGGKVLAAFQMSLDSGSIVGPVLAGLIADRYGFGWAFGVTAVLSVVAVIAWIPARESFPARAARAAAEQP